MPASSDSQIGMQATDVTRHTKTTKAMEISLFSWSSPEEQRLSALWFLAILAERLESGNLPVFRNKCTLGIPLLANSHNNNIPSQHFMGTHYIHQTLCGVCYLHYLTDLQTTIIPRPYYIVPTSEKMLYLSCPVLGMQNSMNASSEEFD